MQIKKIQINNFGKLKNKEIELNPRNKYNIWRKRKRKIDTPRFHNKYVLRHKQNKKWQRNIKLR